jgi:hypothetical protein
LSMAKVRTRSMDGVYPLEKGAVRQGVEGQPVRQRKPGWMRIKT